LWQVFATERAERGDILFVKGAHAGVSELPVGAGQADYGVNSFGQHNAFAVELRFYGQVPATLPGAARKSRTRKCSPVPVTNENTQRQTLPEKHAGSSTDGAPQPVVEPPAKKLKLNRRAFAEPGSSTDRASQPVAKGMRNAIVFGATGSVPKPVTKTTRNALVWGVAESTWKKLRAYWDERSDNVTVFKEAKDMRNLLFCKRKHPVAEDLWIPGASQNVTAVVSEQHVMSQLFEVITTRENWLKQEGLHLNCQMRDGQGLERHRYMQHVKAPRAISIYAS